MKKNNARYIQIAFFVQPTVQWSEKVTLVACVQAVFFLFLHLLWLKVLTQSLE